MGKSHEQQAVLGTRIAEAEQLVAVGGLYRHYKSEAKTYEVLGVGVVEADDSLSVIYKAKYGAELTFLRPLDSWLEKVEWDGQIVPRFTELSD